jgi:hypothetical protein
MSVGISTSPRSTNDGLPLEQSCWRELHPYNRESEGETVTYHDFAVYAAVQIGEHADSYDSP